MGLGATTQLSTPTVALLGLGIALQPAVALAQGLETHHPVIPTASVAGESGPGTLWVNPANIAYDKDARFGAYFSRGGLDAPTSVAATIGVDRFGLGVHNHLRPTATGGVDSDWSVDYATSLEIERVAVGANLAWNFISGSRNYVGVDAGAAWRPLPWFGVGAVAQNIGDPDPQADARPRSAAGIALRPFGPLFVLGADFATVFGVDPNDANVDEYHALGTLRVRPTEGLYLRGGVDVRLDGNNPQVTGGGGLEIYFRGFGAGYVASTDLAATGQTLFLATDEPGESLFRSGRRVPSLELDRTPPYQPRGGLFSDGSASWLDTLELLRRLEDDGGVRGLVLTLDGAAMSLARCRELRQRIEALQAKGKPVLVYLTGSPSNADYYVASAAAQVAMHPATELRLVGLSVELTHLKGLLDLVGVEAQFVKRADYKSSPETYTEVGPTPANLEMTEALIDDLYATFVDEIAAGRSVEPVVVRGWIDGGPHAPSEALAAKIVDVLLYPDELEQALNKLHQANVTVDDLYDLPQPHSPWEDPQQIAVIYIEGAIVPGNSGRPGLFSGRSAGAKTIVRALERAADDRQVQAVVIRVDSPGGSSFASEEIWRAVERLKKEGKPVVVSMGGVAASGGYYVAAGADAIWAQPNTITGSIGVYSGKFSIGEVQERLGVSTTHVARGRNASIASQSRPWDDVQRARMQALVDDTYGVFKERVAEGRSLEPDAVEAVARGRVWSGTRAETHGLVDAIGGFPEAIADARQRAGIPANRKIGIVTYSDSGALLESLAPAIATSVLGPVHWLGFQLGIEALTPPELPPVLRHWLDPLEDALVPVMYPEESVWLLDPFPLKVE